MSITKLLFVLLSIAGIAARASAAPVLTGVVLFNATETGDHDYTGVAWNTVGGDAVFNLYVQDSNSNWLNAGDGAGTGLNIELTPGIYHLSIFGEPGVESENGFVGVNLFFDNWATPEISAFNYTGSIEAPFANGGVTLDLNATGTVNGANALHFHRSGVVATMSEFIWNPPSVRIGDFVEGFNNVPNYRGGDFYGSMTIEVIANPEPGTWMMVTGALVVLGFRRRFRL
ncbi:MAG: hypothetical protein ACKV22_15495 [Bryobacteraceae bacterium]